MTLGFAYLWFFTVITGFVGRALWPDAPLAVTLAAVFGVGVLAFLVGAATELVVKRVTA